jgi:hypothetical protein
MGHLLGNDAEKSALEMAAQAAVKAVGTGLHHAGERAVAIAG